MKQHWRERSALIEPALCTVRLPVTPVQVAMLVSQFEKGYMKRYQISEAGYLFLDNRCGYRRAH